MIKKTIVMIMLILFFSLGCGGSSGGGNDIQVQTAQDIHDNLCLELGCGSGCIIYTEEDPDGAGTIQWCEKGD